MPWHSGFQWTALNYSPLVLIVGVLVGIWWVVDARKRYTGPVRTIDEAPMAEEKPAAGAAPAPGS